MSKAFDTSQLIFTPDSAVQTISDLTLSGTVKTTPHIISNAGTDFILDGNNGLWQKFFVPLTGNRVLTIQNLGAGQSVGLVIQLDGGTVDLSVVTQWAGGAAPTSFEPVHEVEIYRNEEDTAYVGRSIGGRA